ncbi:MarR family transcriptional regulator [Embleya hyalina]|uniref:MarR family transcriptional regulator n=2 Tax=Embleya hyalina TaxID=516124 RepID=A0A401YT21_9ACTN|nr:MarR family transcriptional regulator [Embleya hyalina]
MAYSRLDYDRTMTAAASPADLSADLTRLIWTLHRTLRAVAEPPDGHHVRPPAQVEMLQLVLDRPGISVREAAETLRMMPNNVSNLVTLLVRDNLLERRPAISDRRLVELHPTPEMLTGGRQVRSGMASRITDALAELPPESIARIRAASPDLWALTEALAPPRATHHEGPTPAAGSNPAPMTSTGRGMTTS